MKPKPNINQFNSTSSVDAFLESGNSGTNNTPTAPKLKSKVYREQKVFRLPIDLIEALKKESYEQSLKTGSRITETELVEQALRAFLNI